MSMSVREAILVNSALGAPMVGVGFYASWYLGLTFLVIVAVITRQSITE